MKKKHTYAATDVEKFDVALVLSLLTVGCIVSVDVAKSKFMAAIATAAGEVIRILRFVHPRQTMTFLGMVESLQNAQLAPRVVMEPTGTYGDAVRHQLYQRGVRVEMMAPKHTHDIAEVIDGVPSMHDPKATVALARLAVLKPGKPWVPESESRREVRALLEQRGPLATTLSLYHGHLESMLARHWPELDGLIDLHAARSWIALVKQYASPHAVAASSAEAAELLRRASRGALSDARVAQLVESAKTTVGVPMTPNEASRLRFTVEQIEQQLKWIDAIDEKLVEHVAADEEASRLAAVVGNACAASVISHVGSPTSFESAGAFEKAIGLNLRVKSSGESHGKVHITKRGAPQVRQLLYLAALRMVKSDRIVTAWYSGRKSFPQEGGGKIKALVAVMRKLARALWHVARGNAFDASKLFDVRRLDLTTMVEVGAKDETPPLPSTQTEVSSGSAPRRRSQSRVSPRKGGVTQMHA